MPYLVCCIVYAYSFGNHVCYHYIISLLIFINAFGLDFHSKLNCSSYILFCFLFFVSYFSYLIWFFKPNLDIFYFDKEFSLLTHIVVTDLFDLIVRIIVCLLFAYFAEVFPHCFIIYLFICYSNMDFYSSLHNDV